LHRREQYQAAIQSLRTNEETIADMIAKTARHDPIPIPA
jgi:hypothetical protein